MTIYALTKNTISVTCRNFRNLDIDPANPGVDSDPEQLGIYTSEADAIKALKRCTASIEWRRAMAMPLVEAEWHEVISYSCDDAESADECIEYGDCELIDSNTCPTVINISSDFSIEWDGRRWVQA